MFNQFDNLNKAPKKVQPVRSGIEESINLVKNYETGYINKEDFLSEKENLENFMNDYESNKILMNEGGMNALIYEFPIGDNKSLIIKEMRQDKKSGFAQNPPTVELDIQDELHDKHGLPVPLPVAVVESTYRDFDKKIIINRKLIIMEKINGYSIGDYKRDMLSKKILELPDFSIDEFMDKLTSYIKVMHDNSIYHKDLTLNNVMIDDEGSPIIIDFGTTGYGDGQDPYAAPSHLISVNGVRSIQGSRYVSDEQNLISIKGALEEIFKQKQI